MTAAVAENIAPNDTDDTTATEQIESIYARLGLATASERANFLLGASRPASASFDVVISTSSQPF